LIFDMSMIRITSAIAINEKEIEEDFIHSSGPGGQNVNKVATAVQLRFDVKNSPSLPLEVRRRLINLAGRRATEKGVLIINARSYRSQERNRQDALERLITLIQRAAILPRPRRKTRPTFASKQHRLDYKHRRSRTKQDRKTPDMDD